MPDQSANKYVPGTGFGLTVDILCADNGNSGLLVGAATIDCAAATAPLPDLCTIADAATCCYDPRLDQRTDGALATDSTDAAAFADPSVHPITALHAPDSARVIADGGRARTTHLVSECDLTCAATACTGSTRAPATVTAATVSALTDPLQGGSATHWAQMADLKTALTHSGKTPCPA